MVGEVGGRMMNTEVQCHIGDNICFLRNMQIGQPVCNRKLEGSFMLEHTFLQTGTQLLM